MDLDRFLGSPQLARDLLVEPPSRHQVHDLALAGSQGVEPVLDLGPLGALGPGLAAPGQRPLDTVEQLLILEGLLEEVQGAFLHGPDAGRDRRVARDEDDWHCLLGPAQGCLELEPAGAGQPDVEHETRRAIGGIVLQKGLGRGERLHLEPEGADHPGQRPADRLVVVDHVTGHFGRHVRDGLGWPDSAVARFPQPELPRVPRAAHRVTYTPERRLPGSTIRSSARARAPSAPLPVRVPDSGSSAVRAGPEGATTDHERSSRSKWGALERGAPTSPRDGSRGVPGGYPRRSTEVSAERLTPP